MLARCREWVQLAVHKKRARFHIHVDEFILRYALHSARKVSVRSANQPAPYCGHGMRPVRFVRSSGAGIGCALRMQNLLTYRACIGPTYS